MSVMLISVSHDTVVSNKHEEQTRHYYVNFQQYTWPTSMLSIPSFVSSVLTKMQLYHGVPCSQAGVA